MMISNVKQLRAVLLTDAATCLASGLLLSLMPSQLAALLQLPGKLLFYAGLSLFPIAAFIALTATRRAPAPSWVWLIIVGNAAWIAGSLWLALGTLVEPNSLGVAYLIAQAVVVSILTWLEYQGLEHLESSPDETAQPSR